MREGEEDRTNNEKYIYTTITQCILDLLLNESHQELLDPLILKNWSVSEMLYVFSQKTTQKCLTRWQYVEDPVVLGSHCPCF